MVEILSINVLEENRTSNDHNFGYYFQNLKKITMFMEEFQNMKPYLKLWTYKLQLVNPNIINIGLDYARGGGI